MQPEFALDEESATKTNQEVICGKTLWNPIAFPQFEIVIESCSLND